jgi:hypothetical protein
MQILKNKGVGAIYSGTKEIADFDVELDTPTSNCLKSVVVNRTISGELNLVWIQICAELDGPRRYLTGL